MLNNLPPIPEYARYEKRIKTELMKEIDRRIVLISDSHISATSSDAFNLMMFRKTLEEISKIKNVDYIFHLGDLTHEGTYLDYITAKDLISSINNHQFKIIPGNHDARNVGYLLFEEFFGQRGFEIDDEDIYILGVDSSIPDQDSGNLGPSTLKKSQEKFFLNDEKIKIFCFHHQLIPIPYTGRERSAIYDGGDVLDIALKTNIDVILNGHRHVSNIYSLTDGDSDLVVFNCGTMSCNKTRYRELFSYTILDISNTMVKFTVKRMIDGEHFQLARYINRSFYNDHQSSAPLVHTIVHIGNTHFSEKNYKPDLYEKAVKDITAINPDVVVHTGSVTKNNEEEEYKIAKEELKKLPRPLLVLPGYKDLQKYGWDLFPEMIGPFNPIFTDDLINIVGLNSVNPHLNQGTIGRTMMQDVIDKLSQTKDDKYNFIALNHRLTPPPRLKFENILTDSGNVLKQFTNPSSNINFLLMGKNNIGYSLQIEDTILSYCGSICSKSTVELNKHSYNIIRIYEDGFVQVSEKVLELNKEIPIGKYWIRVRKGKKK